MDIRAFLSKEKDCSSLSGNETMNEKKFENKQLDMYLESASCLESLQRVSDIENPPISRFLSY